MAVIGRDLLQAIRPDSRFWRRAMKLGIDFGPDRFVRHSPRAIGLLFAAALPVQRRRVRDLLRRVLGPRPRHVELAETAEVFQNYASCLTEALLLGSARGYRLASSQRGAEHYYACAAEGKGVLLATAHIGGWELAGPVLTDIHPGEVVVAMRRERDERARELQDDARARTGVRVVHIGDSPFDALTLLSSLRQGSVVAMQLDRVPPGMRAREVRLFGEPWRVPEGLLKLAATSGAPILPIFTSRQGFMAYRTEVSLPVRLPRRTTEAELDQAAQALADAMASFVRAHPTQWFHFDPE
jgi:phosphatidylinositol dimannoside acyltransferase